MAQAHATLWWARVRECPGLADAQSLVDREELVPPLFDVAELTIVDESARCSTWTIRIAPEQAGHVRRLVFGCERRLT
jgi:hypothetical protein